MIGAQLATTGILLGTLILQAMIPSLRLFLVMAGAGASCLVAAIMGISTTGRLLAGVPWEVLVMLVSLGLLSSALASSRLFGLLALRTTRLSRANRTWILLLYAGGMYLVSGLVNNLTALLLVLPTLLALLKLVGTRRRHTAWTLGVVLIACNLGGAATPIGDFPAILLLGRGAMGFVDYLVRAAPATLLALLALVAIVVVIVRPAKGLDENPVAARLALATFDRLYRGVRLDLRIFAPAALALVAMLVAWVVVPPSSGVGPELICWVGTGLALAAMPRLGERLLRHGVDVEAALFLLALFVMVGAVRESGVFALAGRLLISSSLDPRLQLALFLVASAILTGLFSAGPGMAALLDVAEVLARYHPPHVVYVGLALSVCAGSSLFLTAATAGPLSQALTERADLQEADGRPIHFGFVEFLPVGLLGFGVILGVGLALALTGLLA